jgi:hypothetical protein
MSAYKEHEATELLAQAGFFKSDLKEAKRVIERESPRFANHEMSTEGAEALWEAARFIATKIGKDEALAFADKLHTQAAVERVESSRKAKQQLRDALYEAVEILFPRAA